MLEVGSQAPDFTLLNQNGEEISLSQFKGKKVILYFYSKDNTPGCTKQACNYAQNYPAIEENPETKVLQAYDVWKLKKMYGREFMGVVRTTYLIDEDGKIIKAFGKVKAASDGDKMLEELTNSK